MPEAQGLDHRDLLLGLLASAASATDVMAFLRLHQVFTSAMTGNTALLGMALGQGRLLAALLSLLALTGYIAGAALGALVQRHDPGHELRDILGVESAVLLGVTLLWWSRGFPAAGPLLQLSVAGTALAMGLQSVAARKINVDGVSTVVFTSTLTSMVMTFMQVGVQRRPGSLFQARRQALAFGIYAAVAVLTATLLRGYDPVAAALPLCAVLAALGLQGRMSRSSRRS